MRLHLPTTVRTYALVAARTSGGPGAFTFLDSLRRPRVSKLEQAPDTIKHLSPRCASLNDAIRTAPARGLKDDVISDLKREYREKCSDEESEAKSKMSRERREAKQQRAEAEKAEQRTGQLRPFSSSNAANQNAFVPKRARTDLTGGEKADLQRLRQLRSRCG
ncbi:MAG: hypothetical protein IPO19_20375 [Rhodoferax sp.]|nr:hypothetical protein [Rhodoferax sp.]